MVALGLGLAAAGPQWRRVATAAVRLLAPELAPVPVQAAEEELAAVAFVSPAQPLRFASADRSPSESDYSAL